MKTIFRLFCGWMAIALTACSGDELSQVADTQNPNATRTVSVKAYTPDEQPESRLAFEEKQDGSLGVSWAAGDAFTVVVDNEKVTFTYDTEKNEFTAQLPESASLTDGTEAYYPAYTGEYSTDLSVQTGKLDSDVTYMEGTYSESTNSFQFSHSTAILKATFSSLPQDAVVSSIEVVSGSNTINIFDTDGLNLADGIYIYLPAIAKDEEVVFNVETNQGIYSATQTVTLNDGIEPGHVYDAEIALIEVFCYLPTGSDIRSFISSATFWDISIVFEANSTETGGDRLGSSLAYGKVVDVNSTTTLKVYTAASKFVFNADCRDMFNGLSGITSITFCDEIDTSGVTDMWDMFSGCSALTSITFGSNFNTSKVMDMSGMFHGCSGLTSLDLSSFNTSEVRKMPSMFEGCSSLNGLDLSSFDTSKVMSMSSMFQNCSSLTSLDLSNFNTSKVWYMSCMFQDCSGLNELNLSNFSTDNLNYVDDMFTGVPTTCAITISSALKTKVSGQLTGYTAVTEP